MDLGPQSNFLCYCVGVSFKVQKNPKELVGWGVLLFFESEIKAVWVGLCKGRTRKRDEPSLRAFFSPHHQVEYLNQKTSSLYPNPPVPHLLGLPLFFLYIGGDGMGNNPPSYIFLSPDGFF